MTDATNTEWARLARAASTAPTTEAGRRLLNALGGPQRDIPNAVGVPLEDYIVAVEAEAEKEARIDEASRCAIHETEAARAALQSLRERVEGLPHGSSCALVVMNVGGCDCHLAAILTEIDRALG
jgi:hypothetical protein